MMAEDTLSVSKLENGTVIDHVPAGRGLTILRILGMEHSSKLVVAVNVESQKYGKKDMIKIADRHLTNKEIDMISLIAPTATINKIESSKVVKKITVELPKTVNGILKCSNLSCVTNIEKEPIVTKFVEADGMLQCAYCDSFMKYEETINYLKI